MRRKRSGLSMVELLVGTLLTVLLMGALVPMLQVSLFSYRQAVSRAQVHQTVRIAMESIGRDLRWAVSIQKPTVGQTLSYVRFTRVNSGQLEEEVVFQKGASSGLHPDTLYRVVGNASPSPITEDTLTQLLFERVGVRSLNLTLTIWDRSTGVIESVESLVECFNVPDE